MAYHASPVIYALEMKFKQLNKSYITAVKISEIMQFIELLWLTLQCKKNKISTGN